MKLASPFFMVCILACACAPADELESTVTVTGEVSYGLSRTCLSPVIAWNDLKGGQLATPEGDVYRIVMDPRGAELAMVMNGHTAGVRGTVKQREGAQWLTVLAYTDTKQRAAHELWRRMCCNACAVSSALISATRPSELHGAEPVSGRHYPLKRNVTAWCRDAQFLWVATDNEVIQIGLDRKGIIQTFDRTRGLPDGAVYQLVSDGGVLWIAHRGGVARLELTTGRITPVAEAAASYAYAYADATGVWIVADTGTFRFARDGGPPEIYPALPTAERICQWVEKGIWTPFWHQTTRHFVTEIVAVENHLYVLSFGDVHEFNGKAWVRTVEDAWGMREGRSCSRRQRSSALPGSGEEQESPGEGSQGTASPTSIWVLGTRGLVEVDPATGEQTEYRPPRIAGGRLSNFTVTDRAVWVASERSSGFSVFGRGRGGLGRLDLVTREWRVWSEIDGQNAEQISAMADHAGELWVVTRQGAYRTESADPGMAHITRKVFHADEMHLHRFSEDTHAWQTTPLPSRVVERRLICGHDGSATMADITPRRIDDLSVGTHTVLASTQLFPAGYFSGYWPCVSAIASRPSLDKPWVGEFRQTPSELNLQGEQPEVLNVSNSGQLVLRAIGHDDVLGLFADADTHWAVTEGCVGWFDESSGRWTKICEPGRRFYWKATAGYDDGSHLYVGSDRGLISRLDFATGRFEVLGALKDRAVTRIVDAGEGCIFVVSEPAPLGTLPVQLAPQLTFLDAEAAVFDGKRLQAVPITAVPGKLEKTGRQQPEWLVRSIERRSTRDKSRGNFLWHASPGATEPRPAYFVKDVFFPQFLCSSPDGSRLWLSTFSGIVRVDVGE